MKVLTPLQQAMITLKLKKCFSHINTIDYHGHLILPRNLEVASHTTEAIQKLKQPRNLTELRSFLGVYNDLKRFVPNLFLHFGAF